MSEISNAVVVGVIALAVIVGILWLMDRDAQREHERWMAAFGNDDEDDEASR